MSEAPEIWDACRYAGLVPVLSADANKYNRGTVLVAGGSAEYPGAPILAARAASRSGAGYVRLAVPAAAVSAARAHLCSIPVTACPHADETFGMQSVAALLEAGAKSDVFVIGPGLSLCEDTKRFVAELAATLKKPAVFDADALNAIAADSQVFMARKGCVNVLTPHEGEAARLLGRKVADRHEDAVELAERFDAVVVLKGPHTLVASRSRTVECVNAGPELAKAGTGDVLAGMIGAFVAQMENALEAAALAVYLHGSAARISASHLSAISVMPEDVVEHIGPAVLELENTSQRRSE